MAINSTQVLSGVATHYATKAVDDSFPPDYGPVQHKKHSETVIELLQQIHRDLAGMETDNVDFVFALQPYPSEYTIEPDWKSRSHVCIFFATATPLRADIDGVGTYLKTVGPGWVVVDVHGRLSTTDSLNHNVIVSYRINEVGGTSL
jgi:hypothetical protein